MNIAINGFGRIGRTFLRVLLANAELWKELSVVAINIGSGKLDMIPHLFKYDTIMGTYKGTVSFQDSKLIVDGHAIQLISVLEPLSLPWKTLGVDWVIECSGKFTSGIEARKHIQAGARHVLISAPAKDEDVSIIPGVNSDIFDKTKHIIVSLGSCTTNAFFPLVKIINDAFGIRQGMMTTIHAYTNSQVLLDVEAKDPRISRAAALNIIPTSTGAMKMLKKVLPEVGDTILAQSIRVPVGTVSLIDFSFVCEKKLSVEAIHDIITDVSQTQMRGIVDLTMEPLVSSDFSGNNNSVVVDGLLTSAQETLGKIFGWYDNEWGYSCRLRDFLLQVVRNHS